MFNIGFLAVSEAVCQHYIGKCVRSTFMLTRPTLAPGCLKNLLSFIEKESSTGSCEKSDIAILFVEIHCHLARRPPTRAVFY